MHFKFIRCSFKWPEIKFIKLFTVVPSRVDNVWAQGYTVFWIFSFNNHHILFYNLTESQSNNRIYIFQLQILKVHIRPCSGPSQVVLVVKNPLPNAGDIRDVGSIPGWGRAPGGGQGNPLKDSSLENPIDRGAWWAKVHRFAKSRTQLKRLCMHARIRPCSDNCTPSWNVLCKRPVPGICHPKEAPSVSCECGLSYFMPFAILCFIIPLSSLLIDFEPCGLHLPGTPAIGGKGGGGALIFTLDSSWKRITHIMLYQAMRHPGNTILQDFWEQQPRVYYITSWGLWFLKMMLALCLLNRNEPQRLANKYLLLNFKRFICNIQFGN